jgi:hypothetical protein
MSDRQPWEIGSYYRAEFPQNLGGDVWGAPINRGIKVPKGTIFFCEGIITKTEKHYGLDAEEIFEDNKYLRLICFDPRFPDTNPRFLNRDLKWSEGLVTSSTLWKKITSPLLLMALVSAGLAP